MPAPSSRLSFAETLSMVLESREAALAKALPGTVEHYENGKADVRPGVHRLVRSEDDPEEDEIEILPVIPNVPVMWPQGRGFSFIGSLNPGDPVLLICCDRDISGWLSKGKPSAPEDARAHSWSSAVAIPGLVHQEYTNEPGDTLALTTKVNARVDALQQKLDALIASFTGHSHALSPIPNPTAAVFPPLSPGATPVTSLTLPPLGSQPSVASSIAKVSS